MPHPHSPLTDEHLNQINEGLTHVQIAESQIMLAKQAGIDVSSHEQQINAAKDRLLAIKRAYFPGR
jgi:hypothetical protein